MGGIKLYMLLFLAVLLSGLAALLPLGWMGAEALSASYRENALREIEANARLFSLSVPADAAGGNRDRLHDLAKAARGGGGSRFTLIAEDGTVLADSDEDAARMENHRNRPEVEAAFARGVGVEIRSSPTLGTDWVYAAVARPDGSVVRAAASMRELDDRLALWWRKVLAAFAVSLAVLLAMAFLAARWLSRPLEAAVAGAERYAAGDFSYRLPLSGSAEMRRLSRTLGVMAGELDSRFKLIRRQRREMKTVFENMSEGILAVDADGRIILANDAAEALLGVSGDIAGQGMERISRNAELLDAIREAGNSDIPFEKEIRLGNDAGDGILVLTHCVRIREDGKEKGVLAVMRDVTRLRRLEIMRRDFIANAAHELRTPVTAIQGCLETVLDASPEDAKNNVRFLEMALRNVERMGAIFDNLLFLAGMESGNAGRAGQIGVSPVSSVIDEAASLCRRAAEERGTSISIECEEGLRARMNPQLIVRALVNLIDNAVKYGQEKGTVTVSACGRGGTTRITVSDRGPGIAPRHQSRVFERFYRINGSPRAKTGSGLGLAIVKHIVLSQGGTIQLKSEIGAGCKFIMTLAGE